MIEFLKISNLALMSEEEIEFSKGFTAVTGETGAGKSVLIGALSMLAGNRFGKEIIKSGADTCRVEATFCFPDALELDEFLSSRGLPKCDDGVLVLARVISREKSGRIFINGAVSTLSVLAELSEFWIDFHGPNEPQKLFSQKNQLQLLDSYAGNFAEKQKYLELYSERKKILQTRENLKNSRRLGADEIEFIKNQIALIDETNPSDENISELERVFKISSKAEEIAEKSSAICEAISGDNGVSDILSSINRISSDLARSSEEATLLHERLEASSIELSDIADGFLRLARECEMSPSQIAEINSKMSAWSAVSRKYGRTPEEVRRARDEMFEKISTQGDVESSLAKLEKDEVEILKKLNPQAEKILNLRKRSAEKLSREVEKLLGVLGFKKAKFSISLKPDSEPSLSCGSSCEFLFSGNAGQSLMPLAKIASSGELARVMLAVKTKLADADSTPLLVFDEVDSNVGGEIGVQIGQELSDLGERHQVFCITHLPQVAARAHNHMLVEKHQTSNSTSIKISQLGAKSKERVLELARMLGDRHSKSAQTHAQKLLAHAE